MNARTPAAIAKAAVIGAGSMGSGIAAQFANAGIPVVLLDIPAREGPRAAIARAGVERQLKAGGFMHRDAAALVTAGNTEDDLGLLADADWIVEAVIEDLDVKQALFRRIEAIRKPDCIVSSNTSTIRRAELLHGAGRRFADHFVITHFFNPPRHMRLVEIVAGEANRPEIVARVRQAAEIDLGKAVVMARDTPGFIANRIGCYWMAMAALEAIRLGLTIEEADAVAGRPFGVPRTAVFGLFDLVGIDLVPHVWKSLEAALPADDDLQNFRLTQHRLFRAMVERGLHGRKTKAGGFYRIDAERRRYALDLASLDYRPEQPADLPELKAAGDDLRALCTTDGKAGAYASTMLTHLVNYAASVGPQIADDVGAIDTAMKLGYGWIKGPFELADQVGAGWIAERLAAAGRTVPPLLAYAVAQRGFYADAGTTMAATAGRTVAAGRPADEIAVASLRRRGTPVLSNAGASLWDMGDGVACFEVHTKMNALTPAVFDALERTIERAPREFSALVIGNDDPRAFSAGADLKVLLDAIIAGDFAGLDAFVARGQNALLRLKYMPIPVVGAAFGLALGGGCEMLLHCDAIAAHAELNAGLPETKVGLVPAWGGCTQLLARMAAKPSIARGPLAAGAAAFDVILPGAVSTSAAEGRDLGILRDGDRITMNRDRLLADAKARARALAHAYRVPERLALVASGPSGKAGLMIKVQGLRRAGGFSAADESIAEHLATVLTGGSGGPTVPMGEADVMRLEREALVDLAKGASTRARIEHMLATGKALRN